MPDPKTPDELADAAFFQTYSDELDAAVMSEESLHQLARDSAALGAVKALKDAADEIELQLRIGLPAISDLLDVGMRHALIIIEETATTYTDQEASHGTE